ncbi:MAG TPA: LLM class flavin-dependent oxidoreductase [Acidimicrobiales bacterium]|jgi:alkanesulfonate monooxygenase SsuD/methylene tetrahydromethanopterin reductase-like flavin-dependent oxidoreductase (luciferase family)|nr:LLM class flavin-dependent oxidoreductase [Acidimicrobiales bacterium]
MRVDTNFFGTVPMPDAGDPSIAPTARRYGNDDAIACYENMIHWAQTADRLGFDTIWFTEHHFQHEGYEVLPNLIMFGLHVAARTEELRMGQMFNVVPQWHPLRLAEDFALADVLTGGRMEFGVGRGTVPREAWSLGTVVASGDNDMSVEHDRQNREQFEEAMEVIKLAWRNERFEYRGKHYTFPPDEIPDRGSYVDDLTLIPKPRRPIDIWQPVTSPETIEYVPRAGHKAVYWLQNPDSQLAKWERYAAIREELGAPVGPGEDRCLVMNLHIAGTREEAERRGRPGHDEFCKFLAPYGRFSSYRLPDGTKAPFGFQPTVEDSMRERIQIVGSIDDAVDILGFWRDLLDLKHVCFFFDYPGLTREEIDEQMHLVVEEVLPRLGERVERRPLPALPAL